jgi:hypothetical protein
MNFDSRARRAVQGIRRAVEVMEMSSTKTPQRPARFDQYRERKSRNQRIAALAVGIAVPVVLLVGAMLVLRSDSGPTAPATAPPVTPTPVSGRTGTFKAPFTYTLPPGWTVGDRGAHYFSLDSADAPTAGLIVLKNVVPAKPDCSGDPMPGVGSSSDAMTSWLSEHPALVATTPRPVTLGAGAGSYVDVRLASDLDPSCPDGLSLVTGEPGTGWEIAQGAKERFYVLDLPAGNTVTIIVTVPRASGFPAVIDEAAPVVESFRFLK